MKLLISSTFHTKDLMTFSLQMIAPLKSYKTLSEVQLSIETTQPSYDSTPEVI